MSFALIKYAIEEIYEALEDLNLTLKATVYKHNVENNLCVCFSYIQFEEHLENLKKLIQGENQNKSLEEIKNGG